MISISIVEDDPRIRSTVQIYLEYQDQFHIYSAVESAEAFWDSLNSEEFPDVILMDIGLPGTGGIEAIKDIKAKFYDANIAMFTIYDDPERIFKSLCAGANGYLIKSTPLEQLKKAIIDLHDGGSPMSPEIARKVVQKFQPNSRHSKDPKLSKREGDIVDCLVDGLSYKMIAGELDISIDTVRHHIRNIYRKLQVNCKAEVITKSLRGDI